jgi:hypothetical protein
MSWSVLRPFKTFGTSRGFRPSLSGLGLRPNSDLGALLTEIWVGKREKGALNLECIIDKSS